MAPPIERGKEKRRKERGRKKRKKLKKRARELIKIRVFGTILFDINHQSAKREEFLLFGGYIAEDVIAEY